MWKIEAVLLSLMFKEIRPKNTSKSPYDFNSQNAVRKFFLSLKKLRLNKTSVAGENEHMNSRFTAV